jgi:hypothetical protein
MMKYTTISSILVALGTLDDLLRATYFSRNLIKKENSIAKYNMIL